MTTIRAKFDGHAFVPESPIDLPVGCELEISFEPVAAKNGAASTLQQLAAIAKQYPENPALPTDLAAQHDHYLYGTPKRP